MDEKILIYTLVSFLTIIISIYAYTRLNILDKPNQRKIHKSPTPLSGGFAIVILITIFTIFYFFNYESYTTLILFVYLCSLSLFIICFLASNLSSPIYSLIPFLFIFPSFSKILIFS